MKKFSDTYGGRQLSLSKRADDDLIDELFLAALRQAEADEEEAGTQPFEGRQEAAPMRFTTCSWALVNTPRVYPETINTTALPPFRRPANVHAARLIAKGPSPGLPSVGSAGLLGLTCPASSPSPPLADEARPPIEDD